MSQGNGVEIDIKADVKDAQNYLKDIQGDGKKIQRAILAGVGSSTRNIVKKDFKNHLHKRTGALYKSIKRKVNRQGSAVFISAWARADNHVFYGHALSEGSTIASKDPDKYLTFKINDKWIKKHSIKLPERDWIQAPAKRYINSPAYKEQLNRIMAKQIEKIEKRRGWK